MTIQERLKQDFETVESTGVEVLGVFLQGSQNYNLAYEDSDIDTKAIVLPCLYNVIMAEKPISYTHVNPDNSHIDVKDIRLMHQCFVKQNINFLEILFTRYYYLNPKYADLYKTLVLSKAEEIAHADNYAAVNCIAGMIYEKRKALQHPYPTLIEKINKFGYDPKQLHHILRCEEFLNRYITGEPFADCLIPKYDIEYLIDVKRGIIPVEEAVSMANLSVEHAKRCVENYKLNNPHVVNEDVQIQLNLATCRIIKEYYRGHIND